ncbi:hypothetical protein ACFWUP_23700 [Nocardia sp. NPDC058658]|uniref:hypothetical protein n=1 Tax=Nocardia sp. NPDC058658 TaxID=3346580 RepID=UPI00365CA613
MTDNLSEAARWGQWLRRIQYLAGEHQRIHDAGPALFDGSGSTDPPEQLWRQRLHQLETDLDATQRDAIVDGVDPGWAEDARVLGARGPHRYGTRQHPDHAAGYQEFYVDMLEVELWHLECMAGLHVARDDRIRTGHWMFGEDPDTERCFVEQMTARWTQVAAFAAAAQITHSEGQHLWGSSIDGLRRVQAVTICAMTDQQLAEQWYAYATPAQRLHPYLQTDTHTAHLLLDGPAVPPSPQQMIADAATALRSQNGRSQLNPGVSPDLASESTAIAATLDAALGDTSEQVWETDTDPPGWSTSDAGISPDF